MKSIAMIRIFTGALTAGFFVAIFSDLLGICPDVSYSSCGAFADDVGYLFLPALSIFVFSILMYFAKNQTQKSWGYFAVTWLVISMVSIFLAPRYGSDWMLPVEKGSVAFFGSILFVVISIIIILYGKFRRDN